MNFTTPVVHDHPPEPDPIPWPTPRCVYTFSVEVTGEGQSTSYEVVDRGPELAELFSHYDFTEVINDDSIPLASGLYNFTVEYLEEWTYFVGECESREPYLHTITMEKLL